jgi:CheY-like chemotaxis protein
LLKFLIIEDDEAARTLLKAILKKNFACVVLEAENGEVGLNILKSDTPNIILLDINMPVMDGNEMLALLKSNPLFRTIPVVVITAMNDKGMVASLLEKGICDYLLKPIEVNETVKRLNRIIARMIGRNDSSNLEAVLKDNFGSPRLLLVENDHKAREQFHKLLGDKFIIQDAKNGTEALSFFTKFSPRYIVVSDKIGLLDKRIITQKIREIASVDETSIFLIVTDVKAVSTKVFVFDGIIKKTEDAVQFKQEILNKILGDEASMANDS